MSRDLIDRDAVLSIQLEIHTKNARETEIVKEVYQAIMDYVRQIPPAEEEKKASPKRTRKKT